MTLCMCSFSWDQKHVALNTGKLKSVGANTPKE